MMAFKYFSFVFIVSTVLCNFGSNALNNSKANDDFVLCDHKSSQNSKDRQNLCKVECYTELGNPGLCQTQILNPCKTLATNTEAKNCNKNEKNSLFKSICCPLKQENKVNPTTTTTNVKPTLKPSTVLPNDNETQEYEECGQRPDIAAIVGGFDAEPNTWPWIVSIYERQTPTSKPHFICGGAIISNKYILSAAHCFVRVRGSPIVANKYVIKLGAFRLSDKNIKFTEVSEIIAHKNYDTIQRYHDIALLRVRFAIQFNPTVGPICLPKGSLFDNNDFVGHESKLIGWGATHFGASISDALQEVDVSVIDNRECDRNYRKINGHESGFPFGINEQFICAGHPNGGKDSCQGDSGGPLALQIDGKWYELGIVSFGYKCAVKGFPGIYTRVRQFINWIQLNIK